MRTINWKKKFFSSTTIFSENGIEIGFLKQKGWKNVFFAELNSKKYRYESKGILKPVSSLYDDILNVVLGTVTYHSFSKKAELKLADGKIYTWHSSSFWDTEWLLKDGEKLVITFSGRDSKGSASSDVEDELLFISGFFIYQYFESMSNTVVITS